MKENSKETPARQGFYRATLESGEELVAEWREHEKGKGKRWWQWVSAAPTIAKEPKPLDGVIEFRPASKVDVEALLRRELTREEKIQVSYEHSMKRNWLKVPQPERRKLEIGQTVRLGNLPKPKVVALHEDGQVVTIEFDATKREPGRDTEVVTGKVFQTWHWLDMVPDSNHYAPSVVRKLAIDEISYHNTALSGVISRYYATGMRADTLYQREYVWTLEDKERLIESIFNGRDIGRFVFVKHPYPRVEDILDGKQRLNALVEFVSSRFTYKGLYWEELCPLDRYYLESRTVQYATVQADHVGEVGLLEIFLNLNAAGVPQTEEHLDKVRKMHEEALAREQA